MAARLAELARAGGRLPTGPGLTWPRRTRGAPVVRLADHDRADEDHWMSAPRRDSATHLIGLLLGTEKDWPTAFETLTRRLDPISYRGVPHHVDTERMTIEPFDLRSPVRHDVVIDR